MNLPREWTAFGGASLTLMGTALCAGASRHVQDSLAWQRYRRQALGNPDAGRSGSPGLLILYRAGGTLGVLIGLVFVAAAAAGRALSSSRFGSGDSRALGACFAALGLCFSALKLSRGAARGPRFLESDPFASGPESRLGERVAGAATWALCVLWTAFGLRLLTETWR